jgi:hypothetical protein
MHGRNYVSKGNLVFAYMGNTKEWYEETLEKSKDILKKYHLPNDTIEDLIEYFAMNSVYDMWVSQAKLRSLLIRAVATQDTGGAVFKSILSQAGSKGNTLSRSNVAVYLKDPELAKVNNNKFKDALTEAIKVNKMVVNAKHGSDMDKAGIHIKYNGKVYKVTNTEKVFKAQEYLGEGNYDKKIVTIDPREAVKVERYESPIFKLKAHDGSDLEVRLIIKKGFKIDSSMLESSKSDKVDLENNRELKKLVQEMKTQKSDLINWRGLYYTLAKMGTSIYLVKLKQKYQKRG